jgi:hypothetical protein
MTLDLQIVPPDVTVEQSKPGVSTCVEVIITKVCDRESAGKSFTKCCK